MLILSYKSTFLSRGGILTLFQYVMGSLPTYYLSLFKICKGVAIKTDKIMQELMWESVGEGKNDHHIS